MIASSIWLCSQRNQWKTETKSANTLLERLAQSTIGITHHRSRITEQPLQVDVVKINLESKLSEVSNGLDRTQNLNFYELDRELMEVNWEGLNAGHSRCKNPLHRMLDQVSHLHENLRVYYNASVHIIYSTTLFQ